MHLTHIPTIEKSAPKMQASSYGKQQQKIQRVKEGQSESIIYKQH